MVMCGMYTMTVGLGHVQAIHGGRMPMIHGIITAGIIVVAGILHGAGMILGTVMHTGGGGVQSIGVGADLCLTLIT